MGMARNLAALLNGSGLVPLASKVTGTLPDANAPSGSVLQIVQATYTVQTSTTSSSAQPSGLTATITPSSSTSKILVIINNPMRKGGSSITGMQIYLYRNGSNIFQPMTNVGYTNPNTADLSWTMSMSYLDSPASTSAITYAMYFSSNAGSGTAYAQIDGNTSNIILMEIAG